MPDSVLDTLDRLEGDFDKVPAAATGGSDLPDGKYQVEIMKPKSGITVQEDSDGCVRGRVAMCVVAGNDQDLVGRFTNKSWNITRKDENGKFILDERGVGYLKADLKLLGIEEVTANQVAVALESLDGTVADITVKSKTDAQGLKRVNVYVNGLATPKGGSEETEY